MTLVQLLNLANQGYPDGFLAEYYDPETGEPRDSSGDTLALFIDRELLEIFDPDASDEAQIACAVRAMEMARANLDGVIAALTRHAAGNAKADTMAWKPILVEFDYTDAGHFSETVKATETQASTLREILSRAEAEGVICPDWYAGEPQQQPTTFEELLERLRWALGHDVVDPE